MTEQLRCPSCQRKLFEIQFNGLVDMSIKCPKCRNVIHLHLDSKKGVRISEVVGKGVSKRG
ncbi:hypothetical protein BHF71_10675 [Vulcanibacillus modesticaldus]|uniref:Com family DNA-binding transcriptional regulator n=1 Tax=Vulcanibacillus modesticaldus TaxID=337097 RepID=A0A1D2YT04_9BACI|nr:hypothetical protein BHF71_10675 [Vulcanibacillus modesticaldus]